MCCKSAATTGNCWSSVGLAAICGPGGLAAGQRCRRRRGQQSIHIRFSYWRRAGSTEFLSVLELDDDVEKPLFAIGAANELRSVIAKWVVGDPPTPQPLTLLGNYR